MTGESDELEIAIDANGQVTVQVRGRPGASCLDYVELFRSALDARVQSVEKTPEFYEEDSHGSSRQSLGQQIAARLKRKT